MKDLEDNFYEVLAREFLSGVVKRMVRVAHTPETIMMLHNSKTRETLCEWVFGQEA